MSTTLPNGLKTPSDGERGTWWDQIIDAIERVDSHVHNGSDSEPIEAKNLTHGSSTLLAASWAAVAGQSGTYKQTVTVPSGYTEGSYSKTFFVDSGSEAGTQIFPAVVKASSTTYDVYINDNSIQVKVIYA